MGKNSNIGSHPMGTIVDSWLAKIKQAEDVRQEKFGQYACEAERFFDGNHDWMWSEQYARGGGGFLDKEGGVLPNFRITCLVADTPVRMADGTEKPVQDVAVGDMVITHTGQARAVVRTYQRPYSGELTTVRLKGFPFPVTMTADHKMAVPDGPDRFRWVRADNLSGEDAMIVGWNRSERSPEFIDTLSVLGDKGRVTDDGRVRFHRGRGAFAINRHIPVCPSLARLIGIYLAEGCLSDRYITFTFGHDEPHYAEETLALVLGLFGVQGKILSNANRPSSIDVRFSSKTLAEFMRLFCPGKAFSKRVPAVFWGADDEVKLALIQGWMNGDGHVRQVKQSRGSGKRPLMYGVSVSPGLARDFTVMALSCGIDAKCYHLPARDRVSAGRVLHARARYSVFLYGEKARALFPSLVAERAGIRHWEKRSFKDQSKFGRIRQIKSLDRAPAPAGTVVYDFEVEEDHSFLAGDITSSNCNKLFEAVALFGPALYHQNPKIAVTPLSQVDVEPEALGINMADPYAAMAYQQLAMQEQMQRSQKRACASVKQRYLDWVQYETDKKSSARKSIDEAIVAGLGYLETNIYQPPSTDLVMPRSRYLSWRDVVVDPDALYWENVQWIAIYRCEPLNLVARRFGLEEDDLKGHLQSFASQTSKRARKQAKENRGGDSFDLVEYWEVFSKNGFGDKLKGQDEGQQKFDYSVFGDYCWCVVAKGIPFPLNCPTSAVMEEEGEQLMQRVQWPVPYWYDQDGWPISRLTFYNKPNEVWPISLFKPAIGELRFINWCLSFLADKVASSCVTYLGMAAEAGASIQKQLSGEMTPFKVVEIATILGKPLDQVVSFLQAPNFPVDIWKMVAEVLDIIDRRTGLTELMYAMTSRQMRSATEATVRNQNLSIRPDDMASRVEDFLSEVAIREMQAARWFCEPKDVYPVVGQMGTMVWQNYIMTDDPASVVRDFDYRIEAGSARKPNKETKIAQLVEIGQYTLPVFQQFAAGGLIEPFNGYMSELCKAMDIDPGPFLVRLPTPEEQGPSPEEQQMQAEMEMKAAELQLKVEEAVLKMKMDQEAHKQELEQDAEMHKQEMEQKRKELELKKQESKAKQQAVKLKPKASEPKGGEKK